MRTARANRGHRLRTLLPAIGLLVIPAFSPLTASADTDLNVGGQAVIAYANGDLVRLRSDPSYDGSIINEYPEGTSVNVIDGPLAGADGTLWYQVSIDGNTGYIISDWLASSGGMLEEISGTAWTNDEVNLRSGPSLADSAIATLPAGTEVTLTGQTMDNWLSVNANGSDGWIYSAFLGQDSGATAAEPANDVPAADEAAVAWNGATGTWHTNDSVNLRSGAGLDQTVITELPASTTVSLTGATSNGFAQASTDYGDGWISQDYLSEGEAVAAAAAPDSSPQTSSQGQALVDYAMQFLGQAYVWAGNQPGGFDCSGLTQYVVQNVLGYDIGHGTAGQTAFGTPVEYGAWQPGDLIFFQNTSDAGISHVGIYIGGGQMIHAENPSTGVTISDVYSDYYTGHYYGAYRLV